MLQESGSGADVVSMAAGDDDEDDDKGRLESRAARLEAVFGDRFPALIPWMPAIGALMGLSVGFVLWLMMGTERVLIDEVIAAVCALFGISVGHHEKNEAESWLNGKEAMNVDEIPANDRPLGTRSRPFDPRDDVVGKHLRF